jgi:divalent metal cation (Fe/Co/Zn/Cd) transporter
MSSAVALVGIAGGMATGATWMDPLAGVAVAVMVVRTGAEVCQDAVSELVRSAREYTYLSLPLL